MNHLLYIGYCIFGVIDKVIIKQMMDIDIAYNIEIISPFFILIMFISEIIISIIFLLLSFCCCSKKENEDIEEKKNSINKRNTEAQIMNDNNGNNEDNNCFNWKIPLISVFDICSFIPLVFANKYDLKDLQLLLSLSAFLLISTTIFTYCYLKYSIYKHHVIGICLIVFGYLIHDIKNIIDFFSHKNIDTLLLYFILILLQIPNSWKEILEKDLIEKKFFNIYLLLLYEGILGCLIITLFIGIHLGFSKIINILFKDILFKDNNIYWIIGLIISCGLFNIFRLNINQTFGPIHRCIGDTFIFLIVWIILMFIDKQKNDNYILIFICYFFIIFGALLFIEIINCNCCCGSDNQKNKIERANEKLRDANFIEEE